MTAHDLAHDIGGQRGFGAIERSQTALFANEWEASVFGMTLACGMLGKWNLDQTRSAREQMQPADYLASSYYEHWLHGLERLLVEHGLLSTAELQSGKAARKTRLSAVTPERVSEILRQGAPTIMPAESEPRFVIGTRVRVRASKPQAGTQSGTPNQTHTRVPCYTRGCEGVIMFHHGAHIFPDQHAASGEKQPQHLYNVRFEGRQLWHAADCKESDEKASAAVYVDLFESYLQATDATP